MGFSGHFIAFQDISSSFWLSRQVNEKPFEDLKHCTAALTRVPWHILGTRAPGAAGATPGGKHDWNMKKLDLGVPPWPHAMETSVSTCQKYL